MSDVTLSLTASQHQSLLKHLFPADGCEAVAIGLCGLARGPLRTRLLVRRIEPIPYSVCTMRRPDGVTWPTEFLVPLLNEAAEHDWAVVKFHGHRGYRQFSAIDDISDRSLFPGIYSWMDTDAPHASVIIMDDGQIFGRVIDSDGEFSDLVRVSVVGDDIVHWDVNDTLRNSPPAFGQRIVQTFGVGTYERLRKLRVAVIGCSGTGSPVIEQLARNCVGSLVLVDPDLVEEKNLNRILNATMDDANATRLKVDVAKRAIEAMGLGTTVEVYPKSLFDSDVVRAVSSCDVLFGCMDTIDGRYLLNKLASFYLLPYFDLGVKIEADGLGGVDQVCGSVHYLQPGGSSLLSRNVFTLEQVRAAGMQRIAPEQYRSQVAEGYIHGVQEDRPAVIQLNSLIASLAVNELLARLHPYRVDPNSEFAVVRISLSHGIFDREPDGDPCSILARHVGRGDVEPLVEWTELSAQRRVA